MKFSNNYIFYPNNKSLERAIAHFIRLLDDPTLDCAPDSSILVQDTFLHTRGNYEQKRFSSSILDTAREFFEAKLTEVTREDKPSDWAEMQLSLGNVYAALGQQTQERDVFEKAIAAFTLSLEEYTQENQPLYWAAVQYDLGTAYQALGKQLSDSKILKSSIDAYTDALLEFRRENNPEEWSATMFQLGTALHSHGKLLKGNRTFQKAVVAYKNALAVLDADNYPFELAATHNNRGVVLHHLAESEENAERFEEAIRSYETALTVCMEQQQPFHLAVLCRVNRSTARAALAELSKDALIAEEASDEFELILACFPHALQPLCAKHCEEQLVKMQAMVKSFSTTA